MIIYKCRFTGDEMLSDAFKPVPVKDDDGNEVVGLIQIDSQKVNKVKQRMTMPKIDIMCICVCPGLTNLSLSIYI